MSRDEDDMYPGIYGVVNRVGLVGTKQIFPLEIVSKNAYTTTRTKVSNFDPNQRELFKMLLSKYVSLCNEGQESYLFRIQQTPISVEMKPLAEDLKQKLERVMEEPVNGDPDLRRIKYHLIPDVVQDIENLLEKLEKK